MTQMGSERTIQISTRQNRFASWMTDVLIYVVVLNLFVEYVDAIVIDSFTISIFTAILLKFMLDLIVGIEHRVHHYFEEKDGPVFRVLGLVAVFSILFGSKFVILEVVDIVFGEHVALGHFVDIVLLIISMMLARRIMRGIYDGLGPATATE